MMRIFGLIKMSYKAICYLYYKLILGHIGHHSYIDHPLRMDGGKSIFIGNRVSVKYKSWLASKPLTGCDKSQLLIEDGCVIGHFNHFFATDSIILHNNVLTADKVYISDNIHGYEDINMPILKQPIVQKGTVEIGEGSWLGENVCVIGANIGKHCIIGANSVVTKDIPDYSVAVGVPAKIIKTYNFITKKWEIFNNEYKTIIKTGGGIFQTQKSLNLLVA